MPYRTILALSCVVVVTMLISREGEAADPAHVKEVEAWRAKHEADYTRQFVPLAGLFFLNEGENAAGSGASNPVRLPARAPASVGRFIYRKGTVRFEPAAGAGVTLKGKPVTSSLTLVADESPTPRDELMVGDLTLWVHPSGDRRAIRMRDPQSALAKSFAGYDWFPIQERFRVTGTFVRDAAPRAIKVPSLTGDPQPYTTEGVVELTLNGQQLRMRPMTTRPGRLFFVFKDTTAGKETYEAARFLYADLKADGTTVMDFNQAYNPPCAFNPFTTCPLPLPENRLKVSIPAGERKYRGAVPK